VPNLVPISSIAASLKTKWPFFGPYYERTWKISRADTVIQNFFNLPPPELHYRFMKSRTRIVFRKKSVSSKMVSAILSPSVTSD